MFGTEAREIKEGQIFIARKVEITEGDKMVLEPVVIYDKDGLPSYEVRY